MKHLLKLLILAILPLAASCSEKPEEEPDYTLNSNAIIGSWELDLAKTDISDGLVAWVKDITVFTFEEGNVYKATGYFGDVEGTYSLSGKGGNIITAKVDDQTHIVFTVTDADDYILHMKASVQTYEKELEMECYRIEIPAQQDFFKDEEGVEFLYDYIYRELNYFASEKQILDDMMVAGASADELLNSHYLYRAWRRAFNCWDYIDMMLDGIAANGSKYQEYLSASKSYKAYLLYNIASSWGDVPRGDKMLPASDILDEAIACAGDCYLLLSEIYLTNGDRAKAKEALSKVNRISVKPDTILPGYVKGHLKLLEQEAAGETGTLDDAWKKSELSYGYCQMLRRLGKVSSLLPTPFAFSKKNT
ncbi:MAG: hypothetical protein K6F21_03225 [Bacteroidales bacterium]|nr:hypothetical protein [Bacteroidales bacterium]